MSPSNPGADLGRSAPGGLDMRAPDPRAADLPAVDLRRLGLGAPAARPVLTLGPGAALALGRAHEVCGPGRIVFAAMAAARAGAAGPGPGRGPVLWIRGPAAEGRLEPDGLAAFFDPARLVLALPGRAAEVTWCAEEALRAGAAALVVAELTGPLGLTAVRRLHLAAEAGAEPAAARGGSAPLVLLLTPDAGGCAGVETRWSLTFAPSTGTPAAPPEGARPAQSPAVPRAVHAATSRRTAPREAGPRDADPFGAPPRHPPPLSPLTASRPPGAAETRSPESPAAPPPFAVPRPCRAAPVAGASAHNRAVPRLAPRFADAPPAWRLELLRARLIPPRRWRAVWRPGPSTGPLRLGPEAPVG